jgi:hypothetical protein
MAFSDQPQPSLLRMWPLVPLGRFATRLIHRARECPDGSMVSSRHHIPEDVAWRLGQAYVGLLGLLSLPLAWTYVEAFHQGTGYYHYYHDILGRRLASHRLGFWSDLPTDLKIIMPLTFVLHTIGLFSAIRWGLVRQELQPLSNKT